MKAGVRPIAVAAAAAAVFFSGDARAEEPVAVTVDAGCTPLVSESELRRLLALELGARRRRRFDEAPVRIGVTCAAPEDAVLAAEGWPALDRKVHLGSVGRERLLSLAITELADAVAREAREPAPPPPAAPPTPPTPPSTTPGESPPARPRARPWAVDVAAMAHAWPSNGRVTAGPRLAITRAVARGVAGGDVALSLGARVEAGSATTSLGRVVARAAAAELGIEQQLDLGAVVASMGARVEAGGAWLVGRPSDTAVAVGGDLGGAWLGAALDPALAIRLAPWLSAVLRAEVGYVAWSVRGLVDGSRGPGWDGVWMGGSLGLSWAP